VGKILFTSNGVIERKTDLIIQITPKIVVDAYTGIKKSDAMTKYEEYVIKGSSSEVLKSDGVDLNNPTTETSIEFDPETGKKISNEEGE
jgi:hypothetical protein